jgi:hypothetical protein
MTKLIKNFDYYLEENKFVLTETYLLKRGFCCNNNCRHCPYIGKMKNIEEITDKNVPTDRCMICGWEGTSNETIEGSKTTPSLCPICFSTDLQDMKYNPYIEDDDVADDDEGSIFA